ncbi:DUF1501 domain-containing protein [Chryseosolibacter indicus]|uniref:DUF1501 domain-containing protein n=1 Tax=Chryseosolibacter indicus TaxID=2782351 RepID=A0ABS5VVX6_9BACT|nr:DUF1501 domain-containing protein [Chryseosolibacter indicus]MBT1705203.1 DUF1501 domain-containing protein [Chryseosolibacter indicus]
MKQSRRDFLKKFPLAMSVPFTLAGTSIKVMGDNSLTRLAAASKSDRVLIILQMHGGNDGLNAVIPVDKYELYYNKRPNIAIPNKNRSRGFVSLDGTLPLEKQVGFHPDMLGMKSLYDHANLAVIQGVSYKKNNGSHFRGRDIWFMGGSADDYLQSGWLGRYLQGEYAPLKYPQDFPNSDMKDPLAIEMGSDLSLVFHQEGNIPTSIAINSPESFAELVEELDGFVDEQIDPRGLPPQGLQGSPYYKELEWILSLEDKTKDYAARLAEVYKKGDSMNGFNNYPKNYPYNAPKGSLTNPLSEQLKIISRLLAGGCQTKVFLVKIGGFDTHAEQVENYDTTMGSHAALLHHISSAMNAFQQDLRTRGLDDRVLTITTSEFGRRVTSNGSYGTDHGTAGPMFIFGKGVKPGIQGDAFKLTPNGHNLDMQYDYRVVYANIMRNWMLNEDDEATATAKLDKIFPNSEDPTKGIMTGGTADGETFFEMPIVSKVITGNGDFIGDRFSMEDPYPNPAKDKISITFYLNSSYLVNIDVYNNQGKKVKTLTSKEYTPGSHTIEADVSALETGTYICEYKCGFFKQAKKLVISK